MTRIKRMIPVLGVVAKLSLCLALLTAACREGNRYRYEDIPPGFDYPAEENALLAKIDRDDRRALREHAWNLWAGLTAPSKSIWNGQVLPVYETWYSSDEVFTPDGAGRSFKFSFETPRQALHARSRDGAEPAAVMAFVKYNRDAAQFIRDQKYYLKSTLDTLNAESDARRAPPERREIEPFPRAAVSLKPVYWLIKNPRSAQSERGLTALPYWDPNYPPPPDGQPPTHLTWARCVAVDPAGKYPPGSRQQVNCNGTAENPKLVEAEVVRLDRFYSYRLTTPEEVAAAARFAQMKSGSGPREQERFVENAGQTPEAGDYIVLCAMHVTTKEIDNWTFQTYWWSPTPDLPPHGDFRTPNVKGIWANYQMCTAYSMDTPVCFNPYLESDLGPMKPYTIDGQTYPADPMAGTRSNCMTCHVRAGWPQAGTNYGRIFNTGYLAPDDPYFAKVTKTDFLWSLVFLSK